MRKTITLGLAVIGFVGATGRVRAAPELLWSQQFFGVTPANEFSNAADLDGGVYVAGTTSGVLPGEAAAGNADVYLKKYGAYGVVVWTRQFGTALGETTGALVVDASGVYVAGSAGALPGQISAGGADAFIRKYDRDGVVIWTRQFGSSAVDRIFSMWIESGAIYVSGVTAGTLPGQVSAGGVDAFLAKYDLDGNAEWIRQFGTTGTEQATGVAADGSGVYMAGWTDGVLPGQASAGSRDAFLLKFDGAGNELWRRQFGSGGSEDVSGLAADGSGVCLAGQTGGVLPGQSSFGGTDAFVSKYDANGAEIWTRQFGTGDLDVARAVKADGSALYVAGITAGALAGPSAGGQDAFVRRYDLAGNEVWTRQFGSTAVDQAFGVGARGGYVVVAGVTGGALPGQTSKGGNDSFAVLYDADGNELWTDQAGGFGPAVSGANAVDASGGAVYLAGSVRGPLPGQISAGSDDAFLRKSDSAGNLLWERQFGTGTQDFATAVKASPEGIYVGGHALGALPGQSREGDFDPFLRKYDHLGNEIWTRQFGTTGFDLLHGLALDESGVYVCGYVRGRLPAQPQLGEDAFVRKYDFDGNELWTRQFGTAFEDQALAVAAGPGGVYIAGITWGAFPGFLSAAGYADAFLCKFDPDGNEIWTRQFGSGVSDLACALAVDAAGGVFVTGQTGGTLPGQLSAGQSDGYVARYDSSGNQIWIRQFGTADGDEPRGVLLSQSGVYVAGVTTGTFAGQSNAGGIWDAFLYSADFHGAERWVSQFGTSGGDVVSGAAFEGNIVSLSGRTSGRLPGHTGTGGSDTIAIGLLVGPSIVEIQAPAEPVLANAAVPVQATFNYVTAHAPHTAIWHWGDGTSSAGLLVEAAGAGVVSGSHAYPAPGVYRLTLEIQDSTGEIDAATHEYVVVYDPAGGSVTGAGTIDSPAGAYLPDPALTGRAIFGFVSRYQKGAAKPDGNTQFRFMAARFVFASETYEWLVIAGAKAMYKGVGTVNGEPGFGFLISAVDGAIRGGPDKFRIKIWSRASGVVVYDNNLGSAEDAEPATVVQGGNVVIHKKK